MTINTNFKNFKKAACDGLLQYVNVLTSDGQYIGSLDGEKIFSGSRDCHWNGRREENVHYFSPPGLCKWEDEVIVEKQ